MDILRVVKVSCIGLSLMGLILPVSPLQAAPPGAAAIPRQLAPKPTEAVGDVQLDTGGRLHGLVVNIRGIPIARATVSVQQLGRELAGTESDALGRFSVSGLRGGMYQLVVGSHGRLVRAWAAETAPPAASQFALIIVGPDVVRGQLPAEEFFASDAVVVCGLVAAMIAIPIAVNNSHGSKAPASP